MQLWMRLIRQHSLRFTNRKIWKRPQAYWVLFSSLPYFGRTWQHSHGTSGFTTTRLNSRLNTVSIRKNRCCIVTVNVIWPNNWKNWNRKKRKINLFRKCLWNSKKMSGIQIHRLLLLLMQLPLSLFQKKQLPSFTKTPNWIPFQLLLSTHPLSDNFIHRLRKVFACRSRWLGRFLLKKMCRAYSSEQKPKNRYSFESIVIGVLWINLRA